MTDTRNIRFRFKRFTATVHGLCINHYKSQWVNTGTLVDHRSFSQNRLTWSSYPQKRSSRFSPTTQIEPYSKYSTKTNEHNNAMKKNTTSTGVPVPSVCFCLVCLSLSLSVMFNCFQIKPSPLIDHQCLASRHIHKCVGLGRCPMRFIFAEQN